MSNEIIFLFYNSCSPFLYPLCSFGIVINPFWGFVHACTLLWLRFTTHVGNLELILIWTDILKLQVALQSPTSVTNIDEAVVDL